MRLLCAFKTSSKLKNETAIATAHPSNRPSARLFTSLIFSTLSTTAARKMLCMCGNLVNNFLVVQYNYQASWLHSVSVHLELQSIQV